MAESGFVVFVPEAERLVGALRFEHDQSAQLGMPAHITILFPFMEPAAVSTQVVQTCAALLAMQRTFPFRLESVGRFPATAYLEPKPTEPFMALTDALCRAFPQFPPFRGEFASVIPHLTVAHGNAANADAVAVRLHELLSSVGAISALCSAVVLADNSSGTWRPMHVFPLTSSTGPHEGAPVLPAEHGVRGTQGYAERAAELIERYESIPFDVKHREVLHLIPSTPTDVMDIGAGTGADAAWLAAQGHRVLAIEPTQAFREYGLGRHPSTLIQWLDGSLPRLDLVIQQKREFGLVMLTAVWMHLDKHERRAAMRVLASFLAPDGLLILALRHGPVPSGRVMFAVSAEETVALAEAEGLCCVLNVSADSKLPENREAGVKWSRLAFRRA